MYPADMDSIKINFRCPGELVERIDEDAEADHRDRTSMINKIIATYYDERPITKKKAGK